MAFGSITQMITDILQRAPRSGEVAAYQARQTNGGLSDADIVRANSSLGSLPTRKPPMLFFRTPLLPGVYGARP